jgi:hypothetical protein
MDDGRIPLSPAHVEELGRRARRRLRRIAGILLVVGAVFALGMVGLWGMDRPLDSIRVLPTTVALIAFAFERMGKASLAGRASRLAASTPDGQWYLDGHRIMSVADPKLMFRASKKMRAELTAMPTATVVSK